MLSLLFEVGELRCAIACSRIDEVLPLSLLERVPGSASHVAGLLAFRGSMVPVLDTGMLLTGAPCPRKLSTRLVVISGAQRFALICAGAHDVQVLRSLPDGAQDASPHGLISCVMLAGDRAVHCLAIDVLSGRTSLLHHEEVRESSRTTA
jgi:chemotaxis signal transduction protein